MLRLFNAMIIHFLIYKELMHFGIQPYFRWVDDILKLQLPQN